MPITPKSYSATASVTIDGTDVTTAPVTIMTGATHGSLIRTLELSNTGDYDAVAHIRRLDADENVYADIKVDLPPRKPLVLWDEFIVIGEGHVLQLEADSDDIGATASVYEGFPAPPVVTDGYVRVFIAGTEDGQWSLDAGTTWHDSGETVAVTAGSQTITFKPVTGIYEPFPRSITVVAGTLHQIAGTYTTFYSGNTVYVYIGGTLTPAFNVADTGTLRLTFTQAIVDGALYAGIEATTLIDAGPGWTSVGELLWSGAGVVTFAVKSGALYKVTQPPSPAATLLDATKTWTAVYGRYGTDKGLMGDTVTDTGYGYTSDGGLYWLTASGITLAKSGVSAQNMGLCITSDGKLYRVSNRATVVQAGSATDWASLLSVNFAVNTTGELFYIPFTGAPVKMGTGTAWATGKVAGSNSGIDGDGQLYRLNTTAGTTTQIGSATNWTDCFPFDAATIALNASGAAYLYSDSTGDLIAQVDDTKTWSAIGMNGLVVDTDGKLYETDKDTGAVTQFGSATTWSVVAVGPYDILRLPVLDN